MLDYDKKMMLSEKQFRHKSSGEYETVDLHTPYHLIALMLNQSFGQANENFYKIRWIWIIYHVAMQGTIFNRADIVANILSSCIAAALGGLNQTKFEFYVALCWLIVSCALIRSQIWIETGIQPGLLCTLHTNSCGHTSITIYTKPSAKIFWYRDTNWFFLKNVTLCPKKYWRL